MSEWIPAAISGASELLGGMFTNSAQRQANYQNQQRWLETRDLSWWDRQRRVDEFNMNRDAQYEFATNSTKWNMQQLFDAADQGGIHRLAALGGGGSTYQPVSSTGGGMPNAPGSIATDHSFIGDAVGNVLGAMLRSREEKRKDKLTDAQIAMYEADAERSRALAAATSRTQISRARNSGFAVDPDTGAIDLSQISDSGSEYGNSQKGPSPYSPGTPPGEGDTKGQPNWFTINRALAGYGEQPDETLALVLRDGDLFPVVFELIRRNSSLRPYSDFLRKQYRLWRGNKPQREQAVRNIISLVRRNQRAIRESVKEWGTTHGSQGGNWRQD